MNKINDVKALIRRINAELALELALAVVILAWALYRFREATMPILLDDEFAYWSNSSFFMGTDWISVTENVGYYSYGYSLILTLIRLFLQFMSYRGWAETYQAAVMVNAVFLVISFAIAVTISKRYLHNLKPYLRIIVCFVAVAYPSNMIYAHTTMTECTLTFLFWIFAYTAMRVIDKPGILNHMALAAVSFYMYTVHQRSLAILITSVLLVAYIRLNRINRMRHIVSYSLCMYIIYIVHSEIKSVLQSVNYLGNQPVSLSESLSSVLTGRTLLTLAAIAAVLIWFWIIDKGFVRTASVIAAAAVIAGIVMFFRAGGLDFLAAKGANQDRLSTNDFSGQWEKIVNIFSVRGLIRLGTSIVGKWFYLAAGTGVVICWGMKDTIKNTFWMTIESIKRAGNAILHRDNTPLSKVSGDWTSHIWFLMMFFAWAGTFMICAIYKEGLYKVDDLVHGRYIEFLIGMLIIISADSFYKDKHWFRTWIICMALLVAAGAYCQYVYDELQRTEFELAHATMFGRIFWNYESPTGKVKALLGYVLPLSTVFVMLSKAFGRYITNHKVTLARYAVALIIPVAVWHHIATAIIDNYVVVRNEKQSGALPGVAGWIPVVSGSSKIYFVNDWFSYKQAELLQFMVADRSLIYAGLDEVTLDEDAIYIINSKMLGDARVQEKCEVIRQSGDYCIALNKNLELISEWKEKMERLP
jgi:hypothetical protein